MVWEGISPKPRRQRVFLLKRRKQQKGGGRKIVPLEEKGERVKGGESYQNPRTVKMNKWTSKHTWARWISKTFQNIELTKCSSSGTNETDFCYISEQTVGEGGV